MAKYLNDFEIEHIINEAESNADFESERILHIGKHFHSVIKVSKIHKLILIEGNENTGYQHIGKRHDYFKSRLNWKKRKLGTGSKFSAQTTGIIDYVKIADKIYGIENIVKDDELNNGYEVYKAILTLDQVECSYKLLVYEGTKIIHTLYPEESISIWKRPEKFNYIRIVSDVSIDYANAVRRVTINYKNKMQEIIFSIKIKKNYPLQVESIDIIDVIQNYTIFKTEISLSENFNPTALDVIMYDDADLEILEQKILDYNTV